MPALLIECAFCDSQRDMANYDCSLVANSIFKGIVNGFEFTSRERKDGNIPIYHTVTSGETLWWISRNYGVKIGDIIKLNEINNRNLIYVGQRLRIK
jgi:N-acetylmuramoyl-L-alanine amidase